MSRKYPDRPFVGIGAVVIKDNTVLLIKRSKPPRVGRWSLPGGAQALAETVHQGALREIKEETDVDAEVVGLVDVVDSITHDDDGRVVYHYTLVDVACRWIGGEARAGGDAADTAWIAMDSLAEMDLWSETERVIRLGWQMVRGKE